MKHLFLITALLLVLFAEATVHRVGSKGYSSIKAALDAASGRDTVMVPAGTYREGNIKIARPVVLIGEGLPVLDGEHRWEVISLKAPFVTIKGFRIIKSGSAALDDPCGIRVYDTHHVTIANNVLEDNFFGIYIQSGKHCIVLNNKLVSHGREEHKIGNGIHCWRSDSLLVAGNTITGHRDGIYFEFVTNSSIEYNRSERNVRYGLHFMFSHGDSYIHNTFRNNGAGVAVMFTKKVKMLNNLFADNWGDAAYGLYLKEISDSEIRGNVFRRNTTGIQMEGTSRMIMEKNTLEDNGWAMKIQASCMENEVRSNNFSGNTFDIGTNGTLVLNTFSGNYWDKYQGYDRDRNGSGDVPYHPLSIFASIAEHNPSAMLLFRSFIITLLDQAEKLIPSLTPDNFVDRMPSMKHIPL